MNARWSWARPSRIGLGIVAAVFGVLGIFAAVAPGAAQGGWDQAYGNLANNSFVNITTHIGVAPRWAFELDGAVSSGGPAVDPKSGLIYVGTANGTLWSFLRDGNFHCSRNFRGSTIVSTPAIFTNGDIAILVTRPLGDKHQTSLVRLASNCGLVWQVDLPFIPGFPSTASGSAKIWTLNDVPFIFVHVRNSTFIDVRTTDPQSFHELIVFDGAGQVFARRRTGDGCITLEGGGGFDSFGDIWDTLTSFWPTVGSVPPLYEAYGWPDSTPAILDTNLRGFATPTSPLVAVTDHNCAVRLEVLQFDPAASPDRRLVKRWGDFAESEGTLLSSPTVTPGGLIAFGTSGHRLRVYDLNTLSLKWSYDTTYAMMHPPALTPDAWIAPSDYLVHFLKPTTGGLLGTARPQPFATDGSLAGLAASLNEVVVPNFDELGIWSHDLLSLTHAQRDDVFRTSSPALTVDGRLYVVAQTDEKSVLFAFGPP
ncbi:MAG TPA: PQQ-binding-like beta-propeller repeat protein [Thermoanaerobaculia bacterium]|jgi:hypothetical protein|nr:PQQ-binding-like beta-propeller repeat protein [Thermoanaerobaculia bacterium]